MDLMLKDTFACSLYMKVCSTICMWRLLRLHLCNLVSSESPYADTAEPTQLSIDQRLA